MLHNKDAFDWLILGARNPYIQVQALDVLKSHFGEKKVGNLLFFFFVNQSKLYVPPFFVRLAKHIFRCAADF